jgi:mRNA interferase RelE/StbE
LALLRGLLRAKLDEPALASWSRNVKKLTDYPGYRLRVGDWRIVYLLREKELIVLAVKIAPREKAYNNECACTQYFGPFP